MIAALPLLLALAEPGVAAPSATPSVTERGSWSAGLGIRPEHASGGTGFGFQSAFRYRFTPTIALDTVGRSVWSPARDAGDDDQFYLALAAGLAWVEADAPSRWATRVSGRLTHVHHATVDSWRDTPGSNLAGDSDGGVEHRSGFELAVGAIAPGFTGLWGQNLRWEIELQAGYLPSSEPFKWTAGLTLGLLIDSVKE